MGEGRDNGRGRVFLFRVGRRGVGGRVDRKCVKRRTLYSGEDMGCSNGTGGGADETTSRRKKRDPPIGEGPISQRPISSTFSQVNWAAEDAINYKTSKEV